MAQSSLEWSKFKFGQIRNHSILKKKIKIFFSYSILWYNPMCLLIWTVKQMWNMSWLWAFRIMTGKELILMIMYFENKYTISMELMIVSYDYHLLWKMTRSTCIFCFHCWVWYSLHLHVMTVIMWNSNWPHFFPDTPCIWFVRNEQGSSRTSLYNKSGTDERNIRLLMIKVWPEISLLLMIINRHKLYHQCVLC